MFILRLIRTFLMITWFSVCWIPFLIYHAYSNICKLSSDLVRFHSYIIYWIFPNISISHSDSRITSTKIIEAFSISLPHCTEPLSPRIKLIHNPSSGHYFQSHGLATSILFSPGPRVSNIPLTLSRSQHIIKPKTTPNPTSPCSISYLQKKKPDGNGEQVPRLRTYHKRQQRRYRCSGCWP